MRKTDEKPPKFKGSVYVEYVSADDAKNAAEQKLKYKDTDLLIMTKYVCTVNLMTHTCTIRKSNRMSFWSLGKLMLP